MKKQELIEIAHEEQEGKVVEMQPTAKETERPEKMSYEQLENIAHQLSEQAKQLYMKLSLLRKCL